MAVQVVLKLDDLNTLYKRSYKVQENQFDYQLMCDLTDTLESLIPDNHHKAAALSAVQIGRLQRAFVMRYYSPNANNFITQIFVNPELEVEPNTQFGSDWSGCFSFDFIRVRVDRPEHILLSSQVITVRKQNDGYNFLEQGFTKQRFSGQTAFVIQHELDHLDGRLTIDYVPSKELEVFLKKRGLVKTPPNNSSRCLYTINQAYALQGRITEAEKVTDIELSDADLHLLNHVLTYRLDNSLKSVISPQSHDLKP